MAIGVGAALVSLLGWLHVYNPPIQFASAPGIHLPQPFNLLMLLRNREWLSFLPVILPLAALDTLASLQILESVKIAGDDYPTAPSLLMNGVGTLAAAALGSPFPTTLYVGHAAHKVNGARSGYSALNGLVTLALCTTGLLPLVLRVVPLEVAGPVIVWFGLVTVGQAFVEVPRTHAVAVVLGLVPILAQWATSLVDSVARKAGSSLAEVLPRMGSDFALGGLVALGQGALLTSMLWAAALALAIDRKFVQSAAWMFAAAVLAAFGIIHAFALTPSGIEGRIGWWVAPAFALSYAAGAVFLLLCGWYERRLAA